VETLEVVVEAVSDDEVVRVHDRVQPGLDRVQCVGAVCKVGACDSALLGVLVLDGLFRHHLLVATNLACDVDQSHSADSIYFLPLVHAYNHLTVQPETQTVLPLFLGKHTELIVLG